MPAIQRRPVAHATLLVHPSSASATTTVDSGKLMEGFFGIMRQWRTSNAESRALLGSPAERTFQNWKSGMSKTLPQDTIRRVGYVAGIYKALAILYSDPELSARWVRAQNAHFGGQTPLERMTAGDVTDLAAVRAYLDAARAPWS